MRILLAIGLGIVSLARAQEFEAASVKPAAPPDSGRMMVGMRGGPGSSDPGRINYTNVQLKEVMAAAYDVKVHQISGPDWLDSERFDITATMAPDTTKAQFHVMLQKLLADRFKLTLHHEKKDLPAFVLTVGKKGSKMKQSEEEPAKKVGEAGADDGSPVEFGAGGRGGPGKMPLGKDGFPDLPGGGRGGPSMIMMPGKAKLMANKTTMAEFADQLERFVNRPVVDQTELKGKFDFVLYFAPDMGAMMGGRGVPPPPPDGGGRGGDGAEEVPTIFVAVQEQLGLKLESQKAAVDVLVIDHMEKVPTEN
ncbi:MAG: TIGR03435 family protein [Bryobacteraceae bacterium]